MACELSPIPDSTEHHYQRGALVSRVTRLQSESTYWSSSADSNSRKRVFRTIWRSLFAWTSSPSILRVRRTVRPTTTLECLQRAKDCHSLCDCVLRCAGKELGTLLLLLPQSYEGQLVGPAKKAANPQSPKTGSCCVAVAVTLARRPLGSERGRPPSS